MTDSVKKTVNALILAIAQRLEERLVANVFSAYWCRGLFGVIGPEDAVNPGGLYR